MGLVPLAGPSDTNRDKQLNWLTTPDAPIECKRVFPELANPNKRDLAIQAMAFGIALVDHLPAHLVRPLFRNDAFELLEGIAGNAAGKAIARAQRHLLKHMKPVKAPPVTDC